MRREAAEEAAAPFSAGPGRTPFPGRCARVPPGPGVCLSACVSALSPRPPALPTAGLVLQGPGRLLAQGRCSAGPTLP